MYVVLLLYYSLIKLLINYYYVVGWLGGYTCDYSLKLSDGVKQAFTPYFTFK